MGALAGGGEERERGVTRPSGHPSCRSRPSGS